VIGWRRDDTAQQGRPATIQAHYRQADSGGLGDHQTSIVMKARKEKGSESSHPEVGEREVPHQARVPR
jgi:hypothetical protein